MAGRKGNGAGGNVTGSGRSETWTLLQGVNLQYPALAGTIVITTLIPYEYTR